MKGLENTLERLLFLCVGSLITTTILNAVFDEIGLSGLTHPWSPFWSAFALAYIIPATVLVTVVLIGVTQDG